MSVLNWPDDFDWPYAGQPTDVPPQFARTMVKLEDQIFWLLDAVRKVNAAGTSFESTKQYTDEADKKAIAEANGYTDKTVARFNAALNKLSEAVEGLNNQIAVTRNPVTGNNDFIYVALKQMYDILRPHTITWNELAATGMTWDELQEELYTYYELEMFANVLINNDEEQRVFFTPSAHIDPYTPGYHADIFVTGTDWETLKTKGFLYSRKGA